MRRLILGLLVLAPAPAAAFAARDMLGHPLTLPAPPQRIVSLVPSATEIIFALGGEDRLVGVTDFCDWPPAARQKRRVGGMLAPSLEAIVALRPDVVVTTDEGNSQATFDQLAGLAIPVFVVRAHHLDDVMALIARLAELTGRAPAAPPLVERRRGRVRRVVEAVRPYARPRVLYVLWPEPLIVPGREGLVTELIELAGGASVTAALPGAYPRLGLEAVVTYRPDVIVLARHGGDETSTLRTTWERLVVLDLRLPRIAAALLAGAALAVAGVGFQALTRNPLADPSILGVSSGAAFGVVVAQLFGVGATVVAALGLTAFAFAGALAAAAAVYLIAASDGRLPVETLLLAGVIVGLFFSAAITVLISVVEFDRLAGVVHWMLGNLRAISPGALTVFGGLLTLGVWLILGRARQLNLLALGEEAAQQLGVEAERLKRRVFVGACLLTATVVAFAGPIGFVGLIVPHAVRLLLGPDNRLLVPAALLAGASFLLLADTLARDAIAPGELSVGVITTVCGAPFFVYLLRVRHRGGSLL